MMLFWIENQYYYELEILFGSPPLRYNTLKAKDSFFFIERINLNVLMFYVPK